MKNQHTPGPWRVSPVSRPDLDDDPMGQYDVEPAVSQLSERYFNCEPESDELDDVHAENAANARLIAASPDLLAALRDILDGKGNQRGVLERARAAILKTE